MVNRIIRYTMAALVVLLAAITLIWAGLSWYLARHADGFRKQLIETLKQRTGGEARIGRLSVSFLRSFPAFSLRVEDIQLTDSLFQHHRRPLFRAGTIYLQPDYAGLLTGKLRVARVTVRDGAFEIFTDSSGYTNGYLLQQRSARQHGPQKPLPLFRARNMRMRYSHAIRNKLHEGTVRQLSCRIQKQGSVYDADIDLELLAGGLGFNIAKGSYIRGRALEGRFRLRFDDEARDLLVQKVRLKIDRQPFLFDGQFHIDDISPDFNLTIRGEEVGFQSVVAMLPENIRSKMEQYRLSKPVRLDIRLSGKTLYRYIPLVRVAMQVEENDLQTPYGLFQDCSFEASFINEKISEQPRVDENSVIQLRQFRGRWEDIGLNVQSATISNLNRPFLECDLESDLDMASFNRLAGSHTLDFRQGHALVNIRFAGPIHGGDSIVSTINGEVRVKDADIRYIPRNLLFSGCNGLLQFEDNDLRVREFRTRVGETELRMSGGARNFLSLINVSPEKLVVDWDIYSPRLQLSDFSGFLSSPGKGEFTKREAYFGSASSRIDRMFTEGNVRVRLQSPDAGYKTFRAAAVDAQVLLTANSLVLERASLRHAQGDMQASGRLLNGSKGNPVYLKAKLRDMEIPAFFAAFANFGQDALTHENLRGILTADVEYWTVISNDAAVIPDSSRGTVRFLLENGELIRFGPLLELEKKFKKQDFSHIRFADLKNVLELRGSAILIHPMEIRSTALNFFVEGIYDVEKGTDMAIRLPLNNLTRSQADTDLSDEGEIKKGIVLRLRARTGEDGKLSFSWDPLGRSLRKKRKAQDAVDSP